METVQQRLIVLFEALETLEEAIILFDEYEKIVRKADTEKNEALFLAMRDSMIKRFKYCTDLLWKTVKLYLEDIEKINVSINSPRGIIREATKARVISEDEGDLCMEMIECRNKTTHIYHELTAEEIALQVPEFYDLMMSIANRMQSNKG